MIQKSADTLWILLIMVSIGLGVGSYWMVGLCFK